jgi:hypothetical protein
MVGGNMTSAIIGAAIMAALFLSHFVAFQMGRRQKKIDTVAKLTEEEEREAKKRLEGFENIMNYDYDVAIGRRANK